VNNFRKLKKIKKLSELNENGIITSDEFEKLRLNIFNKKSFWSKKKMIISGIIIAMLMIIAFLSYMAYSSYINRPFVKFNNLYKQDKIIQAVYVYENTTDRQEKNEILNFVKNDISDVVKKYIDEKILFEKTNKKLKGIRVFYLVKSEVDNKLAYVSKIKSSRDAFNLANKYLVENDLLNAAFNFINVVKEDEKDYKIANEQLDELRKLKTKIITVAVKQIIELLNDARHLDINGHGYIDYGSVADAANIWEKALKIFPNDLILKSIKKKIYLKVVELSLEDKFSSDLFGERKLIKQLLKELK
jgi:tetratricopeptide (TPR) repeat protein